MTIPFREDELLLLFVWFGFAQSTHAKFGGQLFCVHFIMVCFDGCEAPIFHFKFDLVFSFSEIRISNEAK